MAYMNQERKSKIAAALKPVLARHQMKGSLSVRNHMTIVLTLTSGPIDFVSNYNRVTAKNNPTRHRDVTEQHLDVNKYWLASNFDGAAHQFLTEALEALKSADWFDKSDVQSDYFCTAYYMDISVGKWNRPYVVTR